MQGAFLLNARAGNKHGPARGHTHPARRELIGQGSCLRLHRDGDARFRMLRNGAENNLLQGFFGPWAAITTSSVPSVPYDRTSTDPCFADKAEL